MTQTTDQSMQTRVSLRPVSDADWHFLADLYASTRTEELAVVPWSDEQKTAFLAQQFAAQRVHYASYYADAAHDLILLDGVPAGRFYVARWDKEIRVVDIALLPAFRGQGVGHFLLSRLFGEADAAGKHVTIHVESMNPARRLYQRLGFVQVSEDGVYIFMERAPATPGAPER